MPRRRQSAIPSVLLVAGLLAAALPAACGDGADDPATRAAPAPAAAPAPDPVERAADAAVHSLLDVESLASTVLRAGLERLSREQRAAIHAWLGEVRAAAPAPPPLRYNLDTERFDVTSRTWRVDVHIPGLAAALDAPDAHLALVLEPLPGTTAPTAPFRIADVRLVLR